MGNLESEVHLHVFGLCEENTWKTYKLSAKKDTWLALLNQSASSIRTVGTFRRFQDPIEELTLVVFPLEEPGSKLSSWAVVL